MKEAGLLNVTKMETVQQMINLVGAGVEDNFSYLERRYLVKYALVLQPVEYFAVIQLDQITITRGITNRFRLGHYLTWACY